MNRYPTWKYIVILLALITGALYAAPNLYFDDPALQIAGNRHATIDDQTLVRVEASLKDSGIEYKSAIIDEKGVLIRFKDEADRQTAKHSLEELLGPNYVVALNYARTTPDFLKAVNALPMYMGLDLRGGLHFLIEIEMETAFQQQLERYKNDIFDYFKNNKEKKLRARSMLVKGDAIELKYKSEAKRDEVLSQIRNRIIDLDYSTFERGDNYYIKAEIKQAKLEEHRSNTISQIITVLKKRIDDKYQGLMEPIIVRQGDSRIVAEFPGIQNSE
jgi:preprotein translocase subunit SecD